MARWPLCMPGRLRVIHFLKMQQDDKSPEPVSIWEIFTHFLSACTSLQHALFSPMCVNRTHSCLLAQSLWHIGRCLSPSFSLLSSPSQNNTIKEAVSLLVSVNIFERDSTPNRAWVRFWGWSVSAQDCKTPYIILIHFWKKRQWADAKALVARIVKDTKKSLVLHTEPTALFVIKKNWVQVPAAVWHSCQSGVSGPL